MDDIEPLPRVMWIDIPRLSGLAGEEITQHLADNLPPGPYNEISGRGDVEPLDMEATLRESASPSWGHYDDVSNPAPNTEARLPPEALLDLLQIKFINKTRPVVKCVRVDFSLSSRPLTPGEVLPMY
eukprot:jgi/Tetstr1/443760/TSEL_031748.t1